MFNLLLRRNYTPYTKTETKVELDSAKKSTLKPLAIDDNYA